MNKRLFLASCLALSMIATKMPTEVSASTEDYATDAMANAVRNGLLKGNENGDLLPEGEFTRGELASIMSRAFGATNKADLSSFKDMSKDNWYYDDIALATEMGLLVGTGEGEMSPNGTVSRGESMVILANAFHLEEGNASDLSGFKDVDSIPFWAYDSVVAMVSAGYTLTGDTLDLSAPMLRKDFAYLMDQMVTTYVDSDLSQDVSGSVLVNASGVTLSNMTIKGDLIVADGVGEGTVILDNVIVEGVLRNRGGKDAVELRGNSGFGSKPSGSLEVENDGERLSLSVANFNASKGSFVQGKDATALNQTTASDVVSFAQKLVAEGVTVSWESDFNLSKSGIRTWKEGYTTEDATTEFSLADISDGSITGSLNFSDGTSSETVSVEWSWERLYPSDVFPVYTFYDEPITYYDYNTDSVNSFTTSQSYLTLPVYSGDSTFNVTEPVLAGTFDREYFYVDENGWLVFDCPTSANGGATTANSVYSRTEFREKISDYTDTSSSASNTPNWGFDNSHTLSSTTKVIEVPENGRTITAQIHAIALSGSNGPVPLKVEYDYSKKAVVVYMAATSALKTGNFVFMFPDVDLGQEYYTDVLMADGTLYVTIGTYDADGSYREETFWRDLVKTDPEWPVLWQNYFKVGNYVQDAVDENGRATVLIKDVEINHFNGVDYVAPEKVVIDQTTLTVDKGQTSGLTASFEPVFTTDKEVSWSVVSGGENLAIAPDGTVVGIQYGNAVVRVTSNDDPSVYSELDVTVGSVENAPAEVIFESDLSQDTTFDLATAVAKGGFYQSNTADNVTAGIVTEDGNSFFRAADGAGDGNSQTYLFFQPQYDEVTISFDVRVETQSETGRTGSAASSGILNDWMYIDFAGVTDDDGNTVGFSNSTEVLYRFRNSNTNFGATTEYEDHYWTETSGYTLFQRNSSYAIFDIGQWKRFDVIITPDNGSANANTVTTYIDGMKVTDRLPLTNTSPFVNQMKFFSGSSDLITFSIDNVKVSSGAVAPDTVYPSEPASVSFLSDIPDTLNVGDTMQIVAEVSPVDANENIVFSISEGTSLAVSSDGFLVAKETGSATLRASSVVDATVYVEQTITVG